MCCCDWSAPITSSIHLPLASMPPATSSPSTTAKLVACQMVSPAARLLLLETAVATAGVVAVARKLNRMNDREKSEVLMPSAACSSESSVA